MRGETECFEKKVLIQIFILFIMAECGSEHMNTHNAGMGRTATHWEKSSRNDRLKKNFLQSNRNGMPGCSHWYPVCVLSPVNYCCRYSVTESNNGRLISRLRSLPLAAEQGLYLENGFHFACHWVYSVSLCDNCEADRWPNTITHSICSGTYAGIDTQIRHYLVNLNTISLLQQINLK